MNTPTLFSEFSPLSTSNGLGKQMSRKSCRFPFLRAPCPHISINLPPKKKHTIRDPFDLWSLDSFRRYHSKKLGTKTVTCPKKVEDLVQSFGVRVCQTMEMKLWWFMFMVRPWEGFNLEGFWDLRKKGKKETDRDVPLRTTVGRLAGPLWSKLASYLFAWFWAQAAGKQWIIDCV